LKLLRELQALAAKGGVVLLPLMSVRGTRYITTARGDIEKALTMMQATNEFYHEHFGTPCSEKLMAADLKHGIAYWCGRDSELRPILVFRANRIPAAWHKAGSYDKVVRVVTFCFEYFFRYMSVPGVVESFNVLIDLNGLGITQIPVTALKEMYKSMANHYTVRVTRMYICNMSTFLRGVFAIAKSVITERQNQKLCVVTSKADLLKEFAAHQFEKDFGGTKENIKESWPFQLSPGPFTAGYKGGPNKAAVPNVHEAFVPEDLLGRLWDPTLSVEENTRQVYSKTAHSIFRKCGLPIPKGCPLPDEPEQPTANEPEADIIIENNPKAEDDTKLNAWLSDQGEQADRLSSSQDQMFVIEDLPVVEDQVPPEELDDKPAPASCCWFSCHGS